MEIYVQVLYKFYFYPSTRPLFFFFPSIFFSTRKDFQQNDERTNAQDGATFSRKMFAGIIYLHLNTFGEYILRMIAEQMLYISLAYHAAKL